MSVLIQALRYDNLNKMTPESIVKKLQEYMKSIPNVQSCYIFGSFLTKNFGKDSDIDLIIVLKESNIPFIERPFEFSSLIDFIPALDIRIYTTEEFNNLLNSTGECGFWHSVKKSMKQIYSL